MEDIFYGLKRLMLGCSLSNWQKEILLNIRFTVKLEKLKKIFSAETHICQSDVLNQPLQHELDVLIARVS